jgi:hypothetical protein
MIPTDETIFQRGRYTTNQFLFFFFFTDVLWRVGSLSTSRQILDFIDVEVGVTDIDPAMWGPQDS